MEKENLESLLIDYIDGLLNVADQAMVEKELQNENTQKLYFQLKEVMDLMANSKIKSPGIALKQDCLLYTSPSPRDGLLSRMPSSA